ncbi:MAG TPA: DUF1993 domain-containing protein [Stellaceae bacterium]|nr:DUF1993 domain-containing protein [Stellaceae bacterium]
MAFSMSRASIPVFEIGLNALSANLDKAAAFAAAKKIDSAVLVNMRLAPDMFPLSRQIQIATDQAKNGSARLAGVEAPKYEDNETTIDQLKARITKTLAYIKTLDARQIDGAADREINFPLGPNKGQMKGDDYLNHFVLPNFYFHITTAYDILRHCGVEVGKRDFLGSIPLKMV